MKIYLSVLPSDKVFGIYGKNEDPATQKTRKPYTDLVTGTMPTRLRALHPEAAHDYLQIADVMVVSDMLRSAESSLHAWQTPGRNARPPGTSGHNYGFSFDAHVEAVLARMDLRGANQKIKMDKWLEGYNFFCHRRDHKEGSEWWHYNHLPLRHRDKDGGISDRFSNTDGYLQTMIKKAYGPEMSLDDVGAQIALKALGMYDGDIDGKFGRLSRRGLDMFQKRWNLPATRRLDFDTTRLLAFLTAERVEVPLSLSQVTS